VRQRHWFKHTQKETELEEPETEWGDHVTDDEYHARPTRSD
jgi:hypothetical protein